MMLANIGFVFVLQRLLISPVHLFGKTVPFLHSIDFSHIFTVLTIFAIVWDAFNATLYMFLQAILDEKSMAEESLGQIKKNITLLEQLAEEHKKQTVSTRSDIFCWFLHILLPGFTFSCITYFPEHFI